MPVGQPRDFFGAWDHLGRQVLFDSGTNSDGFQRYADSGATTGRKTGNMFLIGHELFLWSPKGFLTGSANTAGSILVGTRFERTDVACTTAALRNNQWREFHRDRFLLREWDMFYFVAPRMSMGASVLWYDASNLRTGRTNAGENLSVFPVGCPTATCRAEAAIGSTPC